MFFTSPHIVKVGDFGFSTHIRHFEEPLKTFCGSPPYAAPELFRDDSYVGPLVDVWALGVLLYFMLTASMPFKAQTVAGLKKQILEGDFTIPEFISVDCQSLIKGILRLDPKARTTLEQIKKSSWLTGMVLPRALPKDRVQRIPTETCSNEKPPALSPAEMLTRDKLNELGIAEEMVEEAKSKGSRSNVIGVYRIVLHRILAESNPSVYERKPSEPILSNYQFLKPQESQNKIKIQKLLKNKKSKACSIL